MLLACSHGLAGPMPTRRELAETLRKESGQYLDSIRGYQWESKTNTTFKGTDDTWPSRHFRCRQRGSAYLMVATEDGPTSQSDRAVAVNSKYAFELNRSSGKDWALAKYHEVVAGSPLPDVFRLREGADAVPRMGSPYWLEDRYWLPDLLERESFKVLQISNVPDTNGPGIVVRYEFPDEGRTDTTHSGTVQLDPNNRWVVKKFEHVATSGGGRQTDHSDE
jgi:hypothetical protein